MNVKKEDTLTKINEWSEEMEQNIGTVNALVRISCGLTMLAWSTAKMAANKPSTGQLFVSMIGAMKVAEGVLRYCPLTEVWKEEKTPL